MNGHLHSQADNKGRASRQLALLAVFVLLSTLSFAGFAYDTSKLSDIQDRLDRATFVTVLAITRYTALNSQDRHQLATAIIDLFAGGKNANISVENHNSQLLVSARARYQPAFVQYFGMASMEASSKSAGAPSLSPQDASIGLSQVLQSTANKSLVSELTNLLLRFEKKNLDADEKLHEIQAANQTVINSKPENLETPSPQPEALTTSAQSPSVKKAPAAGLPIIQNQQNGPPEGDIITLSRGTAKPLLQVEGKTTSTKVSPTATPSTKLEQGSGFRRFLKSKLPTNRKSKTPVKIDIGSLISRSKQHSINTGTRPGFNLLDILAKSRARKTVQKKSNFSWSALWRYMQKTYENAPPAVSAPVSTPSALAQFDAIIIELAFLVLLVTNLILWVMTFLSFRENHLKTDRKNFNSRLQYIIAE